jgi:hypothetical protein
LLPRPSTLTAIATLATGVAPLAAQSAATERTTLGGYGEVHYVNPSGPGTPATVNIPRFVIYLAHSFNDRLSLRSELELEDARIEGGQPGGEVSLEQAYIDYRVGAPLTFRAGLVLVPVGIINETHEPPTFNGVARPEFDNVIIPTTWRDIGIGVVGQVPGAQGLSYRAYLLNGLAASGFDASQGIREGRQEGHLASFATGAVVARLEYARPGLKLGVAGYHGGSANGDTTLGTGLFAAPVTLFAVDGRYTVGPLAFRGEAATIGVSNAREINQLFDQGVARRISGWYVEGAYDLLHFVKSSAAKLNAFVRHERLDTQASVVAGALADPTLAQRITTFGLTFKPVVNVAFKGDFQLRRNQAGQGEDQVLSFGIGYQF